MQDLFYQTKEKKKEAHADLLKDTNSDYFKQVEIDEQDELNDHYVRVNNELNPLVSPKHCRYNFHH